MGNSNPSLPPSCLNEFHPIRYYPITNSASAPVIRELSLGEAYAVPSFEVAEALIARGVDSARIAVSEHHQDHFQLAMGKELIPTVPFDFEQRVVVVLPTYNERFNLEALVAAISRYLTTDILIVDDNSPDGTGELADQLGRQYSHVHVLHRPKKEGLGPAYLAGFTWALHRDYQLIIEMDCDFSHAPWDLPRLVHGSKTADLVIGSRYIPGGGTQNWNAFRRVVSRSGNIYTSLFLGSGIHDWTGGFRCYRRELLTKMTLGTVRAKGYVFQVEMAWRAVQLKAQIREIPIRFSDRTQGSSKLGWPSIAEALREIPRLYFQSPV
jgi:dolichol-phosphate mannosyltransferase